VSDYISLLGLLNKPNLHLSIFVLN